MKLRTLALLLACAGCAPEETPPPSADREASPERRPSREAGGGSRPAGDAPDEARPVDPATTGRIVGTVRFEGEPPRRKPLAMGTEAACQGHASPPLTETVVVTDGGMRDVYVYLKRGVDAWIPPPPPAEPVVMTQEGCLYVPHALALQTGQKLLVRNGDDTTHNVNMKAKRNGINGNYTQGRKQADLEFVFERREHSIPFKCDIHPWMSAWVYVQDHPWFAVSAADGSFAIENVPPGEYSLEAIHEALGKHRVDVTVAAGESATAEFTFTN